MPSVAWAGQRGCCWDPSYQGVSIPIKALPIAAELGEAGIKLNVRRKIGLQQRFGYLSMTTALGSSTTHKTKLMLTPPPPPTSDLVLDFGSNRFFLPQTPFTPAVTCIFRRLSWWVFEPEWNPPSCKKNPNSPYLFVITESRLEGVCGLFWFYFLALQPALMRRNRSVNRYKEILSVEEYSKNKTRSG